MDSLLKDKTEEEKQNIFTVEQIPEEMSTFRSNRTDAELKSVASWLQTADFGEDYKLQMQGKASLLKAEAEMLMRDSKWYDFAKKDSPEMQAVKKSLAYLNNLLEMPFESQIVVDDKTAEMIRHKVPEAYELAISSCDAYIEKKMEEGQAKWGTGKDRMERVRRVKNLLSGEFDSFRFVMSKLSDNNVGTGLTGDTIRDLLASGATRTFYYEDDDNQDVQEDKHVRELMGIVDEKDDLALGMDVPVGEEYFFLTRLHGTLEEDLEGFLDRRIGELKAAKDGKNATAYNMFSEMKRKLGNLKGNEKQKTIDRYIAFLSMDYREYFRKSEEEGTPRRLSDIPLDRTKDPEIFNALQQAGKEEAGMKGLLTDGLGKEAMDYAKYRQTNGAKGAVSAEKNRIAASELATFLDAGDLIVESYMQRVSYQAGGKRKVDTVAYCGYSNGMPYKEFKELVIGRGYEVKVTKEALRDYNRLTMMDMLTAHAPRNMDNLKVFFKLDEEADPPVMMVNGYDSDDESMTFGDKDITLFEQVKKTSPKYKKLRYGKLTGRTRNLITDDYLTEITDATTTSRELRDAVRKEGGTLATPEKMKTWFDPEKAEPLVDALLEKNPESRDDCFEFISTMQTLLAALVTKNKKQESVFTLDNVLKSRDYYEAEARSKITGEKFVALGDTEFHVLMHHAYELFQKLDFTGYEDAVLAKYANLKGDKEEDTPDPIPLEGAAKNPGYLSYALSGFFTKMRDMIKEDEYVMEGHEMYLGLQEAQASVAVGILYDSFEARSRYEDRDIAKKKGKFNDGVKATGRYRDLDREKAKESMKEMLSDVNDKKKTEVPVPKVLHMDKELYNKVVSGLDHFEILKTHMLAAGQSKTNILALKRRMETFKKEALEAERMVNLWADIQGLPDNAIERKFFLDEGDYEKLNGFSNFTLEGSDPFLTE